YRTKLTSAISFRHAPDDLGYGFGRTSIRDVERIPAANDRAVICGCENVGFEFEKLCGGGIEVDQLVQTDVAVWSKTHLVSAVHLGLIGEFLAVDAVAKTDQAKPFFVSFDDEVIAVFVSRVAVNKARHFVPLIVAGAGLLHDHVERR